MDPVALRYHLFGHLSELKVTLPQICLSFLIERRLYLGSIAHEAVARLRNRARWLRIQVYLFPSLVDSLHQDLCLCESLLSRNCCLRPVHHSVVGHHSLHVKVAFENAAGEVPVLHLFARLEVLQSAHIILS